MNAPRQGKPCLVLDIDYTLFDHRSPVEVHPPTGCGVIQLTALFIEYIRADAAVLT